MCKNAKEAQDFYNLQMADAGSVNEAAKEVLSMQDNDIGQLIVDIEASIRVTDKMRLKLANMLLSKVTNYIINDSIQYMNNLESIDDGYDESQERML